eukprot:Phypoly_transcript_01801.p1 GENE.Phypoly_transcript_01801~~Phypoly_transcript_01801.p1  ORF type:complete len:997 (+),score=191.68 Phypoly_transcript_01801:138-3128(+)
MSYQLYFEGPEEKKLFLEVGGIETLESLRGKIEPTFGIPLAQMKFVLAGKEILHDHPLSEYNIDQTKLIYVTGDADVEVTVGGALNTGNFRENVLAGLLPQKHTVSYEGIFNEYSFPNETTERDISNKKISPECNFARFTNPISGAEEFYMTIGLNENMKRGTVRLSTLNVVVLLDTSSDMLKPFHSEGDQKSKLAVTTESVVALMTHLSENNNLGIVAYEDKLQLIHSIAPVPFGTDLVDLKEKILTLTHSDSTDLSAGFDSAVELLLPFASSEKENRLIVFTDKIPSTSGEFELLKNIEASIPKRIYTTVVGVGKEITPELQSAISSLKGANSISLKTTEDVHTFADRLEFNLIPLAFDLSIKVASSDLTVAEVYGTTNDPEKGLLNLPTLFPIPQEEDGRSKGGVVLLKLKPTGEGLVTHPTVQLTTTYESRDGEKQTQTDKVAASQLSKEVFGNAKIRKAVALAVYIKALKKWIDEGLASADATRNPARKDNKDYELTGKEGIPLKITPADSDDFTHLRDYLMGEAIKLSEPMLEQEINMLTSIISITAHGSFYYEPQTEPDTCFQHAINMYFQKNYIDESFLALYTELVKSSAIMVTKLKNSGAKSTCYGTKTVYEKFLTESNSEPMYDADLFGYFEVYRSLQVEDFLDNLAKSKIKELSPIETLFLLEFSLSILPSAGGGLKALLYYTPHLFLHRYARNTSGRDQTLSQQRFCDAASVVPKMFLCHTENGRSHAFAALNELVPTMRAPSLKNSSEIPSTPTRPTSLNLNGISSSSLQSTPASTPRDPSLSSLPTTPISTPSTTPRDPSSLPTTPRDPSLPEDPEAPQAPPTPVSPYKSLWSTVFGFAFGPFASCVIPRCLPKHADAAETEQGDPEEAMEKRSTTPPMMNTTPMKANGVTPKDSFTEESPSRKGSVADMPNGYRYNEHNMPSDTKGEEWILLDSLVGAGLIVNDLPTMFRNYNYAGRASILIVPDTQREPILIGRKNINKK